MYHVNTKHQWLWNNRQLSSHGGKPSLQSCSSLPQECCTSCGMTFMASLMLPNPSESKAVHSWCGDLVSWLDPCRACGAEVLKLDVFLDEPLTHWGYHSFWDVNPEIRLRQAEMNIRPLDSTFKHIHKHIHEPWYTLVAACLAGVLVCCSQNACVWQVLQAPAWKQSGEALCACISSLAAQNKGNHDISELFVSICLEYSEQRQRVMNFLCLECLGSGCWHKWGISHHALKSDLELQLCFQNLQDIWYICT